ncbi:hypothetical protein AMATHDRAFT_151706 [Amanita thiersii Skay4041]|uniref:Uncharacterized protein n=1 Tax=Amanita thiersii Skay4041 TaxID=703135 RepID=A0A2A9NH67_9AGAR|nr:hypothetical protein AMATHDRAFT_151706 [Amanita thiersii Skay4041]
MPATRRSAVKATANKSGVQQERNNKSTNDTETVKRVHDIEALPFVQYTSVVGVHTTLLLFTALFLPRTAFLSDLTRPSRDPNTMTSLDKPQHPFLDELTLSPMSTLAWICVGVVVLQAWWGGWMRRWYVDGIVKGSVEDRKMQRVEWEKQGFRNLRDACLATLGMSVVLHIVLVLFGAPLTNCSTPFATGPECPSDNLIPRTYLLALLLSLLSVPVPAYTLGIPKRGNDSQTLVNRFTWIRLYAELSLRNPFERALVYPTIGAFIGSWIGAIPIALDWDRPWQASTPTLSFIQSRAWPLTPAFGSIAGFTLGSISALTVSSIQYMAHEHLRAQAQSDTTRRKSN